MPGVMTSEEAADLFKRCYPLHPVVSLVLPILCRELAQNERTLFSYLGSNEPYGFKDSIRKLTSVSGFVSLWEIYEYFITISLPYSTIHPPIGDGLKLSQPLNDLAMRRQKRLNLLKPSAAQYIGAHAGLKPSRSVIDLCFPQKEKVQQALTALTRKSIIHFRKYSSEYRVWQGSDFDLEAAVQDELNQISHFSLPESLNERKALPPIVARRHTIETGRLAIFPGPLC